MSRLLVLADDRTGALETAGAMASAGDAVLVVPFGRTVPEDGDVVVVDLASRHLEPAEAAARARSVVAAAPGRRVLVKLDSTLRGNWAVEAAAASSRDTELLVGAGFPAVGRRCRDGVVFDHDVPVADGPAGRDPRRPVTSSRPIEYLAAAGRPDAVVPDIVDDTDLDELGRRWADGTADIVGTAAALGAAVRAMFGPRPIAPEPERALPAVVVIGSLHPAARSQLDALRTAGWTERAGPLRVLATPEPTGPSGDEHAAQELAERVQRALAEDPVRTLVIVGGDTAAAVLGDEPVAVGGLLAPGTPWARRADGTLVITKPGGFGGPDAVLALLGPA